VHVRQSRLAITFHIAKTAVTLAAPRGGRYKRGHCFPLKHGLSGKPVFTLGSKSAGRLFPGSCSDVGV
jgi:hypothetical protein